MAPPTGPTSKLFAWPDETGPYQVRLWLQDIEGRPRIVGLEMWGIAPQNEPWWGPVREGPDSAITASAIRVPLGKWLDDWAAENRRYAEAALRPEFLAEVAKTWPDLPLRQVQKDAAFAKARSAAIDYLEQNVQRRRGRPTVPDELVRLVADQYRQALASGDRAPALAVTRYLQLVKGSDVNEATVRRWIGLARKRGYLPPSKRRT
ncbi:MAG TPA: hypothetical protein VNF24_06905 [Candidatus Acidoferrales bacterium]|nr:hypothetical protein [Candidatus Acidoferrales bacterium]